MDQPNFERAKQYALAQLEQELHPALLYHSLEHTRDSVVPAVERLAAWEGIDDASRLLLETAAWYHDIGFVKQPTDHEVMSVRIAAEVLPCFGYTLPQIASISGMIMATKLPQSPHTPLEAVLADADLDVLGHDTFLKRSGDLRAERAAFGMAMTDEQWYREQLEFLRAHRYWTAAARAIRDAGKQRNIEALAGLLVHAQVSKR